MLKRILVLVALALMVLMPAGVISAQGPTPVTGLGAFLGDSQAGTTPTPITTDPVKEALAKDNYTVFASGNWYDTAGKPVSNSAYVFMLGASPDLKSDAGIQQIASGLVALRNAYPTAASYHVLMLNGPNVYDASTTSNSLQLLASKLMTADAFIAEVINGVRTVNLAGGGTSSTSSAPPAAPTKIQAVATKAPTRAPTRKPTAVSDGCNAPGDKARLWVKNGYSGSMRFTVGGDEWGTHDFDIPADGQYHFIDMPPSSKYTYSASIPGVGKADAKLPPYYAGQCYFLTFTP